MSTVWDKIKATLSRDEKSMQRQLQTQARRAVIKARIAEIESLLADQRYTWYRDTLQTLRDAVIDQMVTTTTPDGLARLAGKLEVLDALLKYPHQLLTMLTYEDKSNGKK